MIWSHKDYITLDHLVTAYRKAKADLYYEKDHCDPRKLVEYEENLGENLRSLLKKLRGKSMSWIEDPAYTGTWSVIPKSIETPQISLTASWRDSDPNEAWNNWITQRTS